MSSKLTKFTYIASIVFIIVLLILIGLITFSDTGALFSFLLLPFLWDSGFLLFMFHLIVIRKEKVKKWRITSAIIASTMFLTTLTIMLTHWRTN